LHDGAARHPPDHRDRPGGDHGVPVRSPLVLRRRRHADRGDGPLLALHRHRVGVPLSDALFDQRALMSSHQHIMPIATTRLIFVALLVLLVATVGAARLPLGILHLPVAMTIATIKAALIMLFFMHLLHSHKLMAIVSVASFLWLGIM